MQKASSFFDKTIPLHFNLSVRRVVRALGVALLLYGTYVVADYTYVFFTHFHFYGPLRQLSAWMPGNQNAYKKRVMLVFPYGWCGDENTAHYMRRAFAKRGVDVLTCNIHPSYGQKSHRCVYKLARWVNAWLQTELVLFLPIDLKQPHRMGGAYRYVGTWGINTLKHLRLGHDFYQYYDGYLHGGEVSWVKERLKVLVPQAHKAFVFAPLSVNRTSVKEPATPRKIFWCGGAWDNARAKTYLPFWKKLVQNDQIHIYGPKHVWRRKQWRFARGCYKGFLPFGQPDLFVRKMRDAGIVLSLHAPEFILMNTTTNRVMEGAASGCLVISDKHPFVMKHFKDSVLYVDQTKSPLEMYRQVQAHLAWIQKHPDLAKEKAWRARKIFNQHFAMDLLIDNLLKAHAQLKAKEAKAKKSLQVVD